jgi:hypothetical protein
LLLLPLRRRDELPLLRPRPPRDRIDELRLRPTLRVPAVRPRVPVELRAPVRRRRVPPRIVSSPPMISSFCMVMRHLLACACIERTRASVCGALR